MSSGLDAIKSVGALLSAEQQLTSCLNRMKEAKKYIFDFEKGDKEIKENESKKEVRTILVQMVLSAFRGNSATVGVAAERAVSALFIASELHGIAVTVVQQTGEDRKSEAKKSVARKEEEREMCHEDREFLKGMHVSKVICVGHMYLYSPLHIPPPLTLHFFSCLLSPHPSTSSLYSLLDSLPSPLFSPITSFYSTHSPVHLHCTALYRTVLDATEKKAQERDEDTKRFLAEEKRRDDERKKEKEEEGSDSLEKLRLKIKSLQVDRFTHQMTFIL
jgi:hypothetical protein